ncbi:Hypothetical_protein [Hexamita inflata]|uniref:Hypothetical_protein n=1 Tax=Hexamita inflata TaxID=28002 RepID=A0AA86PQG7_9EUKA|nr:Hypothetical protein HINF_LOCUS30491 [Hexamita inflata]
MSLMVLQTYRYKCVKLLWKSEMVVGYILPQPENQQDTQDQSDSSQHTSKQKYRRFKSFFRYDRKPLFKLAIVLQLSSKEYIINTGFGFQNLCKKQDHSNAKTRKLYYMYFQKNSSKFQRRINSEVAKLGFINYYVFAHVPGICSDCGA